MLNPSVNDLIPLLFDVSDDIIVQMLEDEPLPALKPILEELLNNKDVDKQRAAAELTAGVIGGRLMDCVILSSVINREFQARNIGLWSSKRSSGNGSNHTSKQSLRI